MPQLQEITLTDVVDDHVHFRKGQMAKLVVPETSKYCIAALAMPNVPRLNTPPKVLFNTTMLTQIIRKAGHECEIIPCMMLDQIDIPTTPDMIDEAIRMGIRDFKCYMVGTTTGSIGHDAAGITDIKKMLPVLKQIEKCGGIFHWHLELPPPVFSLWRERDGVPLLYWLAAECPDLDIVVEHVTHPRMIRAIIELSERVSGTLTGHHLYDTLDIVIGGFANVHAHNKPPHADPDGQTSLWLAAISGLMKFRLGSDTAPHDKSQKECPQGCAGCFTAPHVLLMVWEVFSKLLPAELVQPRMQCFTSDSAVALHGLQRRGKKLRIIPNPSIVPETYNRKGVSLVPYRAGHTYGGSIEVMTA